MTAPLALPPIRLSIEAAKTDLDQFGLARLTGAISDADLAEAQARVREQAAGEEAAGVAFHDSGTEAEGFLNGPNQRVWNLINKGRIFRKLALNKSVQELMIHLLDAPVLLSSFTANIARPGGVAQGIHTDAGFAPRSLPFNIVANAVFMLDEFTDENGGTRVVPGSHLKILDNRQPPPESVAVTGPPGTLVVWDGQLWHGTGANRSSQSRAAILAYFCRPFVRQQENFQLALSPETLADCPPELLAMLGYKVWRTLGNVEGSLHGVLNDPHPTRFVGELTA